MRLISLNAWGGTLYDDLAAWLPDAGADVICLQEVTHTAGCDGWTTFADGVRTLPQRANLFSDIGQLLIPSRGVFDPSDTGPVTTAEGTRLRQEFGVATWFRPPAVMLSHQAPFVHGAFTEYDEWPPDGRPRIAQATRLAEPQGRPILVVNVHGLRDGSGKGDTPARRDQALRLAALVRAARQPEDLVILCGDLNLLPSSETFAILAEVGLTDLVGEADTRTSRYGKPVRSANYLLVSDPSAIRDFRIMREPEVSDHCPLILDL